MWQIDFAVLNMGCQCKHYVVKSGTFFRLKIGEKLALLTHITLLHLNMLKNDHVIVFQENCQKFWRKSVKIGQNSRKQ
jgi:hypothetical protein